MHAQDKQGNTALHLAARCRNRELLSVLLQGGGSAAAHVKNHEGQLPLHVAAKAGDADAVKALVQAEPSTLSIKDLRGFTAQEWAAKRGHQVCTGAVRSIIILPEPSEEASMQSFASSCSSCAST